MIPVKLSLNSKRQMTSCIVFCKVVGCFQTSVVQIYLVTEKIWPVDLIAFIGIWPAAIGIDKRKHEGKVFLKINRSNNINPAEL